MSFSLAGEPAFEAVFERHFEEVCGFLCRRVGRDLGEELAAEGCVRLDRVQAVHSSLLEAKPVKMILPLDALTAWYGAHLLNRILGTLCEIAERLLEPRA